MAYNWNESWVTKADAEERDNGPGAGKKWLAAILISCATLFSVSFGALVYMFVAFTGCATNTTFISLTLIFCIAITVAQLSDDRGEASLLSSASVTAWAVYLLYNAVTKNPNPQCNPMLGEPTAANVVLGLLVVILSLGYTGWSYTAEHKLQLRKPGDDNDSDVPKSDSDTDKDVEGTDGPRTVGGVVVTGKTTTYGTEKSNTKDEEAGETADSGSDDNDDSNPQHLSNSWRLNIVLAAVACWAAVILTHWGTVATNGDVANPSVGTVAMWVVIGSQWFVLLMYLWTLVAPRLFPNRDFS